MMQQFAAPHNGEQVTLGLGDRFILTLPENPTTGYLWDVEWGYESFLRLVRDDYQPGGDPTRLGQGGLHEWRFEATHIGQCALSLALRRPWQPETEATQTYSLAIIIEEHG